MERKQLGLVLIFCGLAAATLVYLADLFAGEPVIFMGPPSWTAMIIVNGTAVLGLVVLGRSAGQNVDEDG